MSDTEQVNGSLKKRVIFVGVGGASCSGKTTLAKHLRSVLPGSFIIHQDDFAPPEQLVPVHPTLNVQDWDDPEGAIEWPRMVNFLRRVRREGKLGDDHKSHDGLNKQTLLPVLEQSLNHWRAYFTQIQQKAAEEEQTEIIWALVDGFLLYWHPELDVRIFLRVTYDTLKKRRNERFGYHTAVQFSSEGSLWQDPPGYWDDIVWPAYLKAHKHIFIAGNVSDGDPVPADESNLSSEDSQDKDTAPCGLPVARLLVLPAETFPIDELFEKTCRTLHEYLSGDLRDPARTL